MGIFSFDENEGVLASAKSRTAINRTIVALIAIALIGGGLALYQSLIAQRSSAIQVGQAFERRATLRGLFRTTIEAESGQRGFLLTGNAAFLRPYETAKSRLPRQLASVLRWEAAGAGEALDRLVREKFMEMEATIVLGRTGRRDRAVEIVQSQIGRRQTDEIRRRVTLLEAQQDRLVTTSLADAERIAGRSYILLGFLALVVLALSIYGVGAAVRTARLETAAQRVAEVEAAELQTRLIARELNHRVKNLFAVVIAIVQLAGRGSTSAADAITRITGRIQALGRAHEVSLGKEQVVDLEKLLRATLEPYKRLNAAIDLSGPPVELPVMRVTPLGMIVHELATNAVKYGAWSNPQGTVRTAWSYSNGAAEEPLAPRTLRVQWDEDGAPSSGVPSVKGFGSRMIDSAVSQLGGQLHREWGENGLSVTLEAPILDAATAAQRSSEPADKDLA